MNDVKIKIKNFGSMQDTDFQIRQITVIKCEEERKKLLTKKLLKSMLSTMAYGYYYLQKDIAFKIRLANQELSRENKYLGESLSILEDVIEERNQRASIDFLKRCYEKASELIGSYIYEKNGIDEDLPSHIQSFKNNPSYFDDYLLENFESAFNICFKNQFNNEEEFKYILEDNQAMLNMFLKEKYWNFFQVKVLKYFEGSKIELSGTLFDKKIESIFEIEDGKCEININDEFQELFNPNEVILIENMKSEDYELIHNPSSVMNEIFHSNTYSTIVHKPDEISELDEFFKIMGGIFVPGKMHANSIKFKSFEKDEELFKNHVSGMNAFAKLQLLYDNDFLRKDSFLILDSVEEGLIPKWKEKLAKLIVFLSKELEISIIVFSENDEFIKSIEKYSMEYGLIDESNFYLKEVSKNA